MVSLHSFIQSLSLILCSLLSLTSLTQLVHAEKTWLYRLGNFPPGRSLTVVHYFTVYHDTNAEFSMQGPVVVDYKGQQALSNNENYQIGIVKAEDFRKVESSKEPQFCCGGSASMNINPDCPYGSLDPKIFPSIKLFNINATTLGSTGFGNQIYKLDEKSLSMPTKSSSSSNSNSGTLYYVVFSNCDSGNESKSKERTAMKFIGGELVISSSMGFLPGEEVPKLSLYLYLIFGYSAMLGVWMVLCSTYSGYLFRIHTYITINITAGLFEVVCRYASLYHWNYLGHRWWSMIFLASCGTTIKQAVSYGILLLICMGLGVTKAQLESKTILKIAATVVGFLVTETFRVSLLSDHEHGIAKTEMSTTTLSFIVAPSSLMMSILLVWTYDSLNATITELNERKQTVKLQTYKALRMSIGFLVVIFLCACAYEMFVMSKIEMSKTWPYLWLFTDCLSHFFFLVLTLTIMYLWKPSENSQNLAYSEQVESEEFGDIGEVEMQETGIEVVEK